MLLYAHMQDKAIRIEISPGELFDRISILEIKGERVQRPEQRDNVFAELTLLNAVQSEHISMTPELHALVSDLKDTNAALWQIEEDIREHERNGYFGASFITLARSVYIRNDQRALLKRRINEFLGSSLREEKDYRTGRSRLAA
jgi:hypothetical protein